MYTDEQQYFWTTCFAAGIERHAGCRSNVGMVKKWSNGIVCQQVGPERRSSRNTQMTLSLASGGKKLQ
jgi:hypothetical protein